MALIGYVEQTDFEAAAAMRGITLQRDTLHTLTLALDYMETLTYAGEKTDPLQPLAFPRDGDTVVPLNIQAAQMECALLYDRGQDPLGDVGQRVTQKTVSDISVSYSDKGNQSTIYRKLNAMLAPFLSNGGSAFQFSVSR